MVERGEGQQLNAGRELVAHEIMPIEIWPQALLLDNRSEQAHNNMIEWDLNRFDGSHFLTSTCADARLEIPLDRQNERIHTIATGGPKNPYEKLLRGRNIQAAISLAHHDGDTVFEGKMPTGCGGLGAKAEIKRNGKSGVPVEDYVESDIHHEDVIIQACISALEVAQLTDKPVLAATQDHLTGEIHPLLAFWTEKGTSSAVWNSTISIQDLLDPSKYDPAKIYQEGLPCLDIEALPDVFQEYIAANRHEMDVLHAQYPNYRQRQKTQNPDAIVLTTDIRPTRLKYPTMFTEPGSFFRLTIPRIKNSIGEDYALDFSDEEIERVFRQLNYPVSHFSNAKTIIIETPDFAKSELIANKLKETDWMANWLEQEKSKIIALETRGGKIYNPTII